MRSSAPASAATSGETIRLATRGTMLAFAVQLLLRLKGLVLIPLVTKAFGAVDYGVWAQVGMMVAIAGSLVKCGLESAITRFLSGQTRSQMRTGFWSSYIWVVLSASLACLLLWLTSSRLAVLFFGSPANAVYVSLAGLFMLATVIRSFGQRYYRISLRIGAFSAIDAAEAVMTAGIALWVVLAGRDLLSLVLALIAGEAFLGVIVLAMVVIHLRPSLPRLAILRRYLRFGLPLVPTGWFMWVVNLSDRLFLVHYRGLGEVGVYALSYGLALMLVDVFFSAIWVTFPPAAAALFNSGDNSALRATTAVAARLGLLLTGAAIAGFSALAPSVLTVLATPVFAKAWFVIPIVALGYLLMIMASFPMTGLELAQKTPVILAIHFGAMVVNVILNVVLIPRFGILGAAVSTLAAFAALLAISLATGNRYLSISLKRDDWAKIVAVAAACLAAGLLLKPHSGLGLLASFGIEGIVFVAVAFGVRALTVQDMRWAWAAFRSRAPAS